MIDFRKIEVDHDIETDDPFINKIRSSLVQNPKNAKSMDPYPVSYSVIWDYSIFKVPIGWSMDEKPTPFLSTVFHSPDNHGSIHFFTFKYGIDHKITWEEAYRYTLTNLKELYGKDTTVKTLTPYNEGHSTWSWESKSNNESGVAYYETYWNRLYLITLEYDQGYEEFKIVFEESVNSLENWEIYE